MTMRVALILAGASLALAASGCWLMALQLAPMGLHAAEAVTVASGDAVTGRQPGEDIGDDDRCSQLTEALPFVTEVRASQAGGIDVRQLGLSDASGKLKWTVVTNKDGAGEGWHHQADIAEMNFAPPLDAALGSGNGRYLIFAPEQALSSAESDRMLSFVTVFGPGNGTFRWHGRTYDYAVMNGLPCFPITATE
jgi:hypothetical protein